MSVRIVANELMICAKDEPAFATLAKRFVSDDNTGMSKAEMACSARDFPPILNRYMNLKQINFYTHGNIAKAYLAGGSVFTETASELLAAPHPGLFAGSGRVLFTGCNIGEGDDGRDFLIAAGRALFAGRGGLIGGSTVATIFGRWGWFDVNLPVWGDLRVIKLDSNGTVLAEKLF